jgi:hypothetical protein
MDIKWEKAPGPKTVTYQTVYESDTDNFEGQAPTKYIKFETQEDIEYPVFNG